MPDSAIPLEWLVQARRDLESSRVLRSASPPLLETAIYHAAQAAEKAIKALLVKQGVSYRQLHHDIPALLTEAVTIEPSLSAFTVRLADFDYYSVESRYPGYPPFTVTETEVDEAIITSEELLKVISALI
jgi:HEPN domain-containing protein